MRNSNQQKILISLGPGTTAFYDLRSFMVDNPITVDDSLRLVLARLEGALGVFFGSAEVERVFSDAATDQVSEKRYVFFDAPKIRVTGYVEEYEPETIEISVEARRALVARCRPILDDARLHSR